MQRTPVWTDAVHLTLARHGESEWNRLGRWQGQSDTPLSTAGVAQARALGSRLRRRKFTRIIASDLRRATVTAEAIGSPFETREEFREMHVGRWDGMARRDIDDREPGEVERCSRERDRPLGGGESHAEFFERVDRGLLRLLEGCVPGDRVLLVGHGGIIRAGAAGLLGGCTRKTWPLPPVGNTAITELQWTPERTTLSVFNDQMHIVAPGDEVLDRPEEVARVLVEPADLESRRGPGPVPEPERVPTDEPVDFADWFASRLPGPRPCLVSPALLEAIATEAFDASPGSGPAPPRPGCYSRLRLGQDGTVVEVYNADPGAAGETGGR